MAELTANDFVHNVVGSNQSAFVLVLVSSGISLGKKGVGRDQIPHHGESNHNICSRRECKPYDEDYVGTLKLVKIWYSRPPLVKKNSAVIISSSHGAPNSGPNTTDYIIC